MMTAFVRAAEDAAVADADADDAMLLRFCGLSLIVCLCLFVCLFCFVVTALDCEG